ncbi:ABC transporter permease [Microbacterium sp. A82]|uniref:ABC transporter permease n=1 Tax=unclassified Microbacterium TaxID=2609290 RepID=UPI003F3BCCA2
MVNRSTGAKHMGALSQPNSMARRVLIGGIAVVIAILIWHMATTQLKLISPLSLPSPETVFSRIVTLSSTPYLGATIWGHAWSSVQIVLGGWLLAGLIGVVLGVGISWSPIIRNLTFPVFQALRSISPIAWIPIALVWLGIDDSARIFIVFIAAVVPWTVNSMDAVRSIDPLLLRAARTLGARRRTLTSVVLPAGLPTLLAGARIALGNAWTALIAAELLAATSGLGFLALNSSRALDTPTMLASMAVIGALGILFSLLMIRLSKIIAPWAKN